MNNNLLKQQLNEALFTLNKLQSENYDGAIHDLEPAQEKINKLLKEINLDRGLVRLAIDCHPHVRTLRNKLDDSSFYGEYTNKCNELANKMRPDVLMLMDKREETSKLFGYKGYVNAILDADNISSIELNNILNSYLNKHLLPVQEKLSKVNISMREWFEWLYSNQKLETVYEPLPLLESFANYFELNEVLPLLDISIDDSFCYASQTDNNNICIHISPIKTISDWCTLFHEFGHACVYANLPKDTLPWLSSLIDEVIAVLFENAAIRFLANDSIKANALDYLLTEYTRTCISGLFELDLWNDKSDPESLYTSWYSKLGVKINPEDWTMDSFRYIDCMNIFAYTIGQELADSLSDDELKGCILKLIKNASNLTLQDIISYI